MSDHKTSSEQEKSLEAENLRLNAIWDQTMKDKGGNGLPHRKTAVLLLAWDPSIDELKVEDEVKELGDVFINDYNYTVREECIKPGPCPQHQVSCILSKFVMDFDDKDTLLIVYYAGHGSPGHSLPGPPGDLILRYETTSQKPHNIRNSILWHRAEHILAETQADVLVIFDCCFAGNLAQTRGDRGFEFMGATDHKSSTNRPGPTSFTSALIWSLKDLVQTRPYFTTTELYNKIMSEAPDFPRHQRPILTHRQAGLYHTQLVLAKVPKDGEFETIEYGKNDEQTPSPKTMIELRLCFTKNVEADEIIEVAQSLKSLIDSRKLNAQRIQWRGYKKFPSPEEYVQDGVQWWRQRARGRRAGSTQGLSPSTPISGQNPHLVLPATPPYSDCGEDYGGSASDGVLAEAKSGIVDASGIMKFKNITLHTSDDSKSYDQQEAFRVTQQDGLSLNTSGRGKLSYHFKELVAGIANASIEAFRQPLPFRWTLIFALISLGLFWVLKYFLVRSPEFLVVPIVRVLVQRG